MIDRGALVGGAIGFALPTILLVMTLTNQPLIYQLAYVIGFGIAMTIIVFKYLIPYNNEKVVK